MVSAVEAFQVTVIEPPEFAAARALRGPAALFYHALNRLGCRVRLAANSFLDDGTNILIGAHLLEANQAERLPATTIVFNTEPLEPQGAALDALLPFARRFQVWDYTARNVAVLRALHVVRAEVLPIGYVPESTTVTHRADKDVDILFYGEASERRRDIVEACARRGLHVVWLRNVYGPDRDAWLARARIVLNIHYRLGTPFEIGRIAHLLANRCAVLTEDVGRDGIDPDLRAGMLVAAAPDIPDACVRLLAHADERQALAERGFELFRRRDFVAGLGAALARRSDAKSARTNGR